MATTRLRSKVAPTANIFVTDGVAVCNGIILAACDACKRKGYMFTVCLLCGHSKGWKVAS